MSVKSIVQLIELNRSDSAARYGAKVDAGLLIRDGRQEAALSRLEKVYNRLRLKPRSPDGGHQWIRPRNIKTTKSFSTEPFATNELAVDEYLNRITLENRQLMLEKGVKIHLTKAEKEGRFASAQPSRQSESVGDLPAANEASASSSHNVRPENPSAVQPMRLKKNSLYLFGSVGRGKTMLLDTFYNSIQEDSDLALRHKRQHFFDFMRKYTNECKLWPDLTPVEIVANTIADETDLLCLDEVDYRKVSDTPGKWAGSRYYHPASSPSVAAKFDGDFERIEGELFQGPWIFDLPHSTTRTLRGGQYKLANSQLRGVIVDFNSLCGKECGEADFSALADHFKLNNTVLFIRDVPVFGQLDGLGSGRRFGKLVEILYDKSIPVRILASNTAERIFAPISNSQDAIEELIGDEISVAARGAVLEASCCALDRSVSRLFEMTHVSDE
ncbi:hypothetical protein FOZ60_001977 [Perkinsus olseni]|uniref:Lactation elevated protein 1 n=1 Tax=Perkinsus olseni TaxID=32597 RepID=A0A7J6NZ90_PEROL|nr:hypothetical protein FOZ60_001977 [Perkinsus olseni]